MGKFSTLQDTFDKIQKLINSSRFNEAFLILKNQMYSYPGISSEIENLNKTETAYSYMLDYIMDGHSDPSMEEMILQTKEALSRGNDVLLREARLVDSPDIYSSIRRMFRLKDTGFRNLISEFKSISDKKEPGVSMDFNYSLTPEVAKISDEIFNYVWTMGPSAEFEYSSISDALDDPEIPDFLKILIVSALVLGNITFFDREVLEIILNQYENSKNPIIKARAITGFVLIALLNPSRIAANLKIRSRLMLLSEDESWAKIVKEVLLNIIKTFDTKRIDDKMRNEVIPELMKINPEILNKFRNLSSDSDDFLSEGNPEWEEMLEQSEIGNKLQEINDMQLEGADIMVTAFSKLKNFPFFYKVSNWFMPFIPGNFEFNSLNLGLNDQTVSRLTGIMCDSDLHSYLLSLTQMPESQRNILLSNMEAQMKEALEAMSDGIGETKEKTISRKIRHSLQDSYRFFNYFRKKDDFKNPFSKALIAGDIKPLIPILGVDKDDLLVIAEFYFKNKYYREALSIFELIEELGNNNFNIWEKIGFCYEKLKDYERASQWYMKAEIVNPDNPWLEKKLALTLKNAGRPLQAVEFYKRALQRDPENYHLLMSYAQCLLESDNYEEALVNFYHAQYLNPDKISPIRALAWGELVAGNKEKAKEIYEKLLLHKDADKTDYLNAAHNAMAAADRKEALKLYKKYIEKSEKKDITELVIAFREDAAVMKKIGIKNSDLRLIIDKIRYDSMK